MSKNTHDVGPAPTRIRSVDSENLEALTPSSSSSSFAAPLTDVPIDGAIDLPTEAPAKPKKQKICCVCGKNVAGEERFKDHSGRYWCMDCGTEDNRKKHAHDHAADPILCPDCKQTFPQGQMVEYEHLRLCSPCAEKREKAHKRELARKAAAEEAAREAERKWKQMMIGATVLAVLAVAYAIYAIIF